MPITCASSPVRLSPQPRASTAVNSGSSVAHSEPKAIARTTAAAMKPMNSLGPPPGCCVACWIPAPPSSTSRPPPRAASAVAISLSYAVFGTSAIGCSPSMWTFANATVLSLAIWRAAAPCANGLSTRSTCGPSRIAFSVLSIRALMAGSVTSRAAKTTWLVSVDSVLKLSPRRFSAVVDSVPGSENESVYPDPALAPRPPRATSATTQTARTTNLRRKHQRARALIGPTKYAHDHTRRPTQHRPAGDRRPERRRGRGVRPRQRRRQHRRAGRQGARRRRRGRLGPALQRRAAARQRALGVRARARAPRLRARGAQGLRRLLRGDHRGVAARRARHRAARRRRRPDRRVHPLHAARRD